MKSRTCLWRKFLTTIPGAFTALLSDSRTKMALTIAMVKDQWILGERLDQILLFSLDYGLHDDTGIRVKIFDMDFFLN